MRTRYPPISSGYKSANSSFSGSSHSVPSGPVGHVHIVEVPPQGGHANVVHRPGEPLPAGAGGHINVGRGAGGGAANVRIASPPPPPLPGGRGAANVRPLAAPQRGRGAANVRRGGGGGAVNVRH